MSRSQIRAVPSSPAVTARAESELKPPAAQPRHETRSAAGTEHSSRPFPRERGAPSRAPRRPAAGRRQTRASPASCHLFPVRCFLAPASSRTSRWWLSAALAVFGIQCAFEASRCGMPRPRIARKTTTTATAIAAAGPGCRCAHLTQALELRRRPGLDGLAREESAQVSARSIIFA